MEFTLNEYHRNVSDEEFLEDILRVARLIGSEGLTMTDYKLHGKYHPSTIANRFGGWRAAIKRAGLSLNKAWSKHDFCEKEEDFLQDMERVASFLGKVNISCGEYGQYGKYSKSPMMKKYGSWDVILKKAGLKSTPYRLGKNKDISDEELFQDIERVWMKLGRQPTITDVKNGEFRFGQNTFARRFGGWRGALEAFVQYINSEEEVAPEENAIIAMPLEEINSGTEKRDLQSPTSPSRKTRRDINLRLRFKVMQRDSFKCCMCGRSPATTPGLELHIDHIKPWSKGGETIMENLQTLCQDCNLGKSDLE